MDSVLTELAATRKVALERNEKFVRVPLSLLADVVSKLIGIEVESDQEEPVLRDLPEPQE